MTLQLVPSRPLLARPLNILVACEESGAVRDEFIRRGHNAVSCDLLPTSTPGPHYQGDVTPLLRMGWDALIAFPPCTFLCSSGLHWNKRPGNVRFGGRQTLEALDFVRLLLGAPIPHIGLENPVGCISTEIRPYDQLIQPYEFGDDASKRTCLWLKNLPPLELMRGHTFRSPGRDTWPASLWELAQEFERGRQLRKRRTKTEPCRVCSL